MRHRNDILGALFVFVGAVALTFAFLLFYGKGWPPSPRELGVLIAGPLGAGGMSTVLYLFPTRFRDAAEVAVYAADAMLDTWKGREGVGYISPDVLPKPQMSVQDSARAAELARQEELRMREISELQARLDVLMGKGQQAAPQTTSGDVVA